MNNLHFSIGLLITAGLMLAACEKSTAPEGDGQLTMYMADAPATYDSVKIAVEEVAVHSATSGWVVINNTPRVFDLLQLTNGAMAVLGDASLQAGKYTEIRLMLGTNNNVVIDGTSHSLTVASGLQTGFKLVQQFDIEEGTKYELLLDFDASRSITSAGGTSYILQPTVRVKALALTGSIGGTVNPASADALITAVAGTDTATTYASSTGAFKVVGLDPATYSLSIQATSGSYRDTTLTGIQVTAGTTANVGTVVLSQ